MKKAAWKIKKEMVKQHLDVSNYMEQSPYWKTELFSWPINCPPFIEVEGSYPLHKSLPLNPILSWINLVYIFTPSVFKIHFNIILPKTLCIRSGPLLSGISENCTWIWQLSHAYEYYMLCPCYLLWTDQPSNIRRRALTESYMENSVRIYMIQGRVQWRH
jgi:hypothetical protein